LNDVAKILLKIFVSTFIEIFGRERAVYNVHSIIHLSEDVRIHGQLDDFSAFPFENFLYTLKRLIRKPNFALQQAILRLGERATFREARMQSSNAPVKLLGRHLAGPHPPPEYGACQQFQSARMGKYVISSLSKDCCVKIGSRPAVVRNIFQNHGGTFVMFFNVSHDFYSYPLSSKKLDIHSLSDLSSDVLVAPIKDVLGKYALLPYHDQQICLPLLHTHLK
jgi:hypothetical protein